MQVGSYCSVVFFVVFYTDKLDSSTELNDGDGLYFYCPQQFLQLIAQHFCSNPLNYHCLRNKQLQFVQTCNYSRTIVEKGFFPIQDENSGDLNSEICPKDLFQRKYSWSNEQSKCLFQKSFCHEEGEIIYSNGNTTEDRHCVCDRANGYKFISHPRNRQYCIPFEEDCSCFRHISFINQEEEYSNTDRQPYARQRFPDWFLGYLAFVICFLLVALVFLIWNSECRLKSVSCIEQDQSGEMLDTIENKKINSSEDTLDALNTNHKDVNKSALTPLQPTRSSGPAISLPANAGLKDYCDVAIISLKKDRDLALDYLHHLKGLTNAFEATLCINMFDEMMTDRNGFQKALRQCRYIFIFISNDFSMEILMQEIDVQHLRQHYLEDVMKCERIRVVCADELNCIPVEFSDLYIINYGQYRRTQDKTKSVYRKRMEYFMRMLHVKR